MPFLLELILDLLLLRRSPPSAISEGSSSGLQMLGLAIFGIGGLGLLFAILMIAHG
jgi:hypothetical protein